MMNRILAFSIIISASSEQGACRELQGHLRDQDQPGIRVKIIENREWLSHESRDNHSLFTFPATPHFSFLISHS